jgi:fimbrial isopeptide formation D2 family protein
MIPDGISRYSGEITVSSFVNGKEISEVDSMKYCYSKDITKVTIQDGIQKIGMEAFLYCINMKSLVLPASLKDIGYAAFRCCTSLKNISFMGTTEQWNSLRIGEHNEAILNATVKCVGDKWEYEEYEDGIVLTGYKNGTPTGEVKLPSEIKGKPVIALGEKFFYRQQSVTSVIIPDTVKEICPRAFEGCTSLTSITIPDSVTDIDNNAFNGCTSLKSVSFSSNSKLRFILKEAFRDCIILDSITLPSSLKSLGDYVFFNCSSLTTMNIPKSLSIIGNGVFLGCDSIKKLTIDSANEWFTITNGALIEVQKKDGQVIRLLRYCPSAFSGEYSVPNGISIIASHAFEGCKNVTSVVLSSSVYSIESCAFSGCIGLSKINLDKVTSIGDKAFEECESLEIVALFSGVSLGVYVFDDCIGIKSIIVEDGVSELTSGLFYNCSGVESITLPASLVSMVDNTFYSRNPIDVTIHFRGTLSQWAYLKRCFKESNLNISVFCEGDYQYQKNEDGTATLTYFGIKDYKGALSIPDLVGDLVVTSISDNVFSECENVTSVNIPDSITRIGEGAFSYCSGLQTVRLSESLAILSRYAFLRCESLTSILIPGSLKIIGESAFRECYKLIQLSISEGVQEIAKNAFYSCTGLVSCNIPSTMIHVYDSAFYGTTKLSTVYYNGTESQFRDSSVIVIDSNNGRLNTYSYITYLVTEPKLTESQINNENVSETSSGNHTYSKVKVGDRIQYQISFRVPSDEGSSVVIQATNELPTGLSFETGSSEVYAIINNEDTEIKSSGFSISGNTLSWNFDVSSGLSVYIQYVAIVNDSATNPIVNRASVKIGEEDWILSNKVQNAM